MNATTATTALIDANTAFAVAVIGYQAFRLDLVTVRAARLDVARAARVLAATTDMPADVDAYFTAVRGAAASARTTRVLVAAHIAGAPRR